MNRLLTLGLLVSSAGGASAGDPVPVLPTPGGSLSQSLPSVVNGGLAVPPPPVLMSQPTWGTPVAPAPYQVYPAVQPMPIPQFQTAPCETGGGSRGTLLGRLRAWLCGGAGPAYRMGLVFQPPVAPPWAWTPTYGHIVGAEGAAGWPAKCEGNRRRLLPLRRPVSGVETGEYTPTVASQPIIIPQPPAFSFQRPHLLRRVWDACVPGGLSFGGRGTGYSTGACASGGCATGTPLMGSLLPGSGALRGRVVPHSIPYFGSNTAFDGTAATLAPAPIPLGAASMVGGYPYAVTTPQAPTTAAQPFTQQK